MGQASASLGAQTAAPVPGRRERLLQRFPDMPWRANFEDVDWDEADLLDADTGLRAFALAPTIPIYLALMRGEQVPIELLSASWVERFGLRRAARVDENGAGIDAFNAIAAPPGGTERRVTIEEIGP